MIIDSDGWIDHAAFTVRKADDFSLDTIGGPVGESVDAWERSLEPGDIVFFRWEMEWWNAISRTASFMDGFFSHVGLYVGDGLVVDSSLSGVGSWSLTDIAESFGNNSCVAVARPRRSAAERAAVANWARGVSRPAHDPTAVEFDSAALATAFVILSKLRLRTALRLRTSPDAIQRSDESLSRIGETVTRAVEDMENRREKFDNPFEDQPVPPGVCSGFVWQAYARASTPLQPALLEGSRIVRGEIFGPPDADPSVLDLLFDEVEKDSFGGPLHGLKSAFAELEPFLRQAKTIIPTLIGTTMGNRRATLLEVVGPGDLFCSLDMGSRWFLDPRHRETAMKWRGEWKAIEASQVAESGRA